LNYQVCSVHNLVSAVCRGCEWLNPSRLLRNAIHFHSLRTMYMYSVMQDPGRQTITCSIYDAVDFQNEIHYHIALWMTTIKSKSQGASWRERSYQLTTTIVPVEPNSYHRFALLLWDEATRAVASWERSGFWNTRKAFSWHERMHPAMYVIAWMQQVSWDLTNPRRAFNRWSFTPHVAGSHYKVWWYRHADTAWYPLWIESFAYL
jgi:hypothetical protein